MANSDLLRLYGLNESLDTKGILDSLEVVLDVAEEGGHVYQEAMSLRRAIQWCRGRPEKLVHWRLRMELWSMTDEGQLETKEKWVVVGAAHDLGFGQGRSEEESAKKELAQVVRQLMPVPEQISLGELQQIDQEAAYQWSQDVGYTHPTLRFHHPSRFAEFLKRYGESPAGAETVNGGGIVGSDLFFSLHPSPQLSGYIIYNPETGWRWAETYQ